VFLPKDRASRVPNRAASSAEQLVNQELVAAGLACVYPGYVEECPHRDTMVAAETVARQQQHGLWADAAPLPWEYRRQKILQQLAHPVEAAKVLARFSSDYLRDGMQQTSLGMASWYGPALHGRLTASGEKFNENALTAAHPSLPFNTRLQVTNLQNNKTVIVRINDHHPAQHGSILDLSKAAAEQLDAIQAGIVPVAMEVLHGR
jgi:rare lipoprotein A